MVKTLKQKLVTIRNFLIFKKYDFLAKVNKTPFRVNPEANFVVSIASYPKRDPLLTAVYEALKRQNSLPKKWILVLSEEDYPQGLPKHLIKLENLGLEILWVKDNPYAVKKLIPVIEKYPHFSIITLDDDIIYHPNLLEGLITEAKKSPNSVIGYVGKAMLKKDSKVHMYYREKLPASKTTPSEQVYLIGWGGIYYPPKSLDERVLHMEAVHRIVPGRGSDFWFWAAAHAVDTKQLCLGVPTSYNLGIAIPQNNETKPKDQPGTEVILERFQMAIDYFSIQEKLLSILPDK
ncbi:glycosyltransferase [Psychroflexus torquis ATCC 700755]|uniref:Glycosyltransferase n=1 Tax=Psychroflexus torquis (strain ATCC 700755 / CIP 106069 / ACAM 623) TaxID=313595 RepID=K4ID65_PSYTT|nr:hypothetical protein [Psychroflexus torquis]AFU68497.1 glycosyltransferase [Psychroflexus torquis ATCC 700755]